MSGDFYFLNPEGLWFVSGETGEATLVKERSRKEQIMANAKAQVIRIQELRRSNAARPIPSGKAYKRRPKHQKGEEQ